MDSVNGFKSHEIVSQYVIVDIETEGDTDIDIDVNIHMVDREIEVQTKIAVEIGRFSPSRRFSCGSMPPYTGTNKTTMVIYKKLGREGDLWLRKD